MKILLDQNVPFPLTRSLPGHDVAHASAAGWETLSNGDLLTAAETDGFEILITADQNIQYQQNLTNRTICLIVLSTNDWPTIRAQLELVMDAATAAVPKGYLEVAFNRPPLRRRPFSSGIDPE